MRLIYFLAIAFVISSCSSTKKTDSVNLTASNTKVVAIKAANTDSVKSNLKNQKDSIQNSNVIKTVQSEMSRINTLLNKKPY